LTLVHVAVHIVAGVKPVLHLKEHVMPTGRLVSVPVHRLDELKTAYLNVLAEGLGQFTATALLITSPLANSPPLSNSKATAAQGQNAAVNRSMSGYLQEIPVITKAQPHMTSVDRLTSNSVHAAGTSNAWQQSKRNPCPLPDQVVSSILAPPHELNTACYL
jgi:hypothetical protein